MGGSILGGLLGFQYWVGFWAFKLVGGSVNWWAFQSIRGWFDQSINCWVRHGRWRWAFALGLCVERLGGPSELGFRVGRFSLAFYIMGRLCKPSRSEEFPGPQRRLVEGAALAVLFASGDK